MDKYLTLFDTRKKDRGVKLYNHNYVEYVVKYRECYYAKVLGQFEDYYMVSIDDNNLDCTCKDNKLCKHIYASLLSIINNKFKVLSLNKLSKEELLNLIDYCINTDFEVVNYINSYNKEKEMFNFDGISLRAISES
jgi:hypothetical protein